MPLTALAVFVRGLQVSQDVVLTVAAQRIAASLRTDDVLARYGGDECVVLMSGVASEAALAAQIDRPSEMLEEPMMIEGRYLLAGGSCGGALYPLRGASLDQLIQVADARMYEQKTAMRQPTGVGTSGASATA